MLPNFFSGGIIIRKSTHFETILTSLWGLLDTLVTLDEVGVCSLCSTSFFSVCVLHQLRARMGEGERGTLEPSGGGPAALPRPAP